MKRRRFLQVIGATGAGVAAGCGGGTPEHLLPYLVPDADIVPGVPTWYASTCRECPAECGILVKTREARAIKVEGNPAHPLSRGRLCARGQAALQGLYDPDRIRQPLRRSPRAPGGGGFEPVSWDAALPEIATALGAARASGPDRIAFIGAAGSGALDGFYDEWLAALGSTRRLRYEPFAYEALREANRLTFGRASVPSYDFAAAKYVLSFGADFLETWLSPVEYTAAFAEGHGFDDGAMSRLVVVEPRRTLTGFSADEWVAPRPGTEGLLALAICQAMVRGGRARALGGAEADRLRAFLVRFDPSRVAEQCGVSVAVIQRLAQEFASASPSLAVAGGTALQHGQATQTAVAANLLNYLAGNVGRTVRFHSASPWDRAGRYADLLELVGAMDAGAVDVVMVHAANPTFTSPRAGGFAAALGKVPLKISFQSHLDETAALCDWVLPDHTPIEQWGDAEPAPGVRSLRQPAMTPVFDTRQTADVLLELARQVGGGLESRFGAASAMELVRRSERWRAVALSRRGPAVPAGLEAAGARAWNAALAAGGVFEPAPPAPPVPVTLVADFMRLRYEASAFDGPAEGPSLLVYPSITLFDGRGANKGWLQELPDPVTKITWQTWLEIHPETAGRLGVTNGDVVRVSSPHGAVEAPVYLYPGVRRDVVAMPLGQGHTAYGRLARGRGANPLDLLSGAADPLSGGPLLLSTRVGLEATGRRVRLATTEGSPRQMGRQIARSLPLAEVRAGAEPEEPHEQTPAELAAIAAAARSQQARARLGIYAKPHPKWEMTIDLSRCTGCGACVAACYAENNIPVVGEDQVVRSREMAWIRLERYFEGDTSGEDWHVSQIPMLCQHCGNAPCEPVCPVYAAYHTPDGLNAQVYNRCVGTRYCANNCPYKVRYFNWYDPSEAGGAHSSWPEPLTWQLNPDVTVRTKGIMEKCTFCVQRIRYAQNRARVEGRAAVADGEIVPACVQTCPAQALVFGDANDPESRLSRSKEDPRGYHVFEHLNTKPAITYLARVLDRAEG